MSNRYIVTVEKHSFGKLFLAMTLSWKNMHLWPSLLEIDPDKKSQNHKSYNSAYDIYSENSSYPYIHEYWSE